jgi:hypothetical protein
MGENPAYAYLHKALAAEFGVFVLRNSLQGHRGAIMDFFVNDATTEQALDMIDVAFRYVLYQSRDSRWRDIFRVQMSSTEAIEDLNIRLLGL